MSCHGQHLSSGKDKASAQHGWPVSILNKVYTSQYGFIRVCCLPHHLRFPSLSLVLELVVHLFVDLWRKELYRVNLVRLLQRFSSLVAVMRIMTFCIEIFGCPIQKMTECFQKPRVVGFMLPSRETNPRRFMSNIKCRNKVKGFGICCVRERPSMLQGLQQKCHQM
ncbi:hypothetical protein ERO13_D07G121100v2 [Gossypium hirsutum]|nr:hypothetical protein ERO13_D07G121100v2 [Gossypium hirsutum]